MADMTGRQITRVTSRVTASRVRITTHRELTCLGTCQKKLHAFALHFQSSILNMFAHQFEVLWHESPDAITLPLSLREKVVMARDGQRAQLSLRMIELKHEAASQKRLVRFLKPHNSMTCDCTSTISLLLLLSLRCRCRDNAAVWRYTFVQLFQN